ncbi:hypothetical protein GCM10010528_09810 [Gordonia defluvii]|jgi:3-oxoacyl-(acyl-carrier-protein) synthase/thioesterase domain-containing protein|uniref:Ketosynthase family 3 (KS3) domain-containing protein n=1 Tax=Gordonia defluvii TaxID=283718 RepID=A0ABP6L6V7_9ACTN|nr:beta-ketoacyl synthase N-terminal-like domain-containing protein [Gordonia sp. UBA5067]
MTEFAVVGASVALPGVTDLAGLHDDLLAARVHIEGLSDADLAAARRAGVDVGHPRYVPVGTDLPEAGRFDAAFFDMTPAEAQWTDPQQRLLLTLTHRAIESAGAVVGGDGVGVYTTVSSSSYLDGRVSAADRPVLGSMDYRSLVGNDRDFAASRIAHRFGFTGPAITVQSACSSSLVALHQACLALSCGDIDVALVAAASIAFPQRIGYRFADGGIMSPTGRSRPFDVQADGTVRGTGGGAVLLRRLDDALAGPDAVLGIVSGTAVNNDGGTAISYSAPSAGGQQRVLTAALARSGAAAGSVRYIEAHGTGTALGDPIEFRALRRVYDDPGAALPECGLGAAKAAYGHLDTAAGMIGLLKTISVLRHQTVYAQPGFTEPNPSLDLAGSRFAIAWEPAAADVPFAAVSSFGMGGTNAHVVLRRPPEPASTHADGPATIVLSARTPAGLARYRRDLADFLTAHPGLSVHDVGATLDARTAADVTWRHTATTLSDLVTALAGGSGDDAPGTTSAVGRPILLPVAPLDERELMLPLVSDSQPAAAVSAGPARPDVAEAFRRLVMAEIGVPVPTGADFYELGGESMGLVSVVGKLADAVGFSPDFTRLDGLTGVDPMAAELAAQAAAELAAQAAAELAAQAAVTQPATDARRPAGLIAMGDGEPLAYLYPPAGGTNFCYTALRRSAPQLSFAAFRAVRPGDSVPDVATACVTTLVDGGHVRDDMVVGGYSFGGNVALEICRQLEGRGVRIGRVLLIDSFAPDAFGAPGSDATGLGVEVADLLATAAGALPDYRADAREQQLRDYFTEIWLENCAALNAYRPAAAVTAPITLLRARTPLSAPRSAALGIDPDRTADWAGWTRSGFQVIDVPGDHYSVFTNAAHRAVTAAVVARVLTGAADRKATR